MVEKIVIPVADDKGLDAVVSEHFGRAPYFASVDIDETGMIFNMEFILNRSEHFGGSGLPPDRIIAMSPSTLITCGMGPRAIERFQEAGVVVLKADAGNLAEYLRFPFTSCLSTPKGSSPTTPSPEPYV